MPIVNFWTTAARLVESKYRRCISERFFIALCSLLDLLFLQPNGGHAFILRRFDTGAISLTTMFRAAFPSASDDAEKAEANWIRANYELSGANGSGAAIPRDPAAPKLRLAGTWVNPDIAMNIADVYALAHIVQPLASANPDPHVEYRRSNKATEASNSPQQQNGTPTKTGLPTPPDRGSQPNPSKRRKESSPVPITTNGNTATGTSSIVRQSTRRKTPIPVPNVTAPRSTRSSMQKVETVITSISQQTLVNEEADEDIAEVPGPDPLVDIEEQKALISRLKAERSTGGLSATSSGGASTSSGIKRTHGESESDREMQFEFKEPEAEKRQIITNRRINLQPEQKSAAWGVALFAAGFAAM